MTADSEAGLEPGCPVGALLPLPSPPPLVGWDPLPLRRGVGHRCLPQFMSLLKKQKINSKKLITP